MAQKVIFFFAIGCLLTRFFLGQNPSYSPPQFSRNPSQKSLTEITKRSQNFPFSLFLLLRLLRVFPTSFTRLSRKGREKAGKRSNSSLLPTQRHAQLFLSQHRAFFFRKNTFSQRNPVNMLNPGFVPFFSPCLFPPARQSLFKSVQSDKSLPPLPLPRSFFFSPPASEIF